jgi:hypothetical protein
VVDTRLFKELLACCINSSPLGREKTHASDRSRGDGTEAVSGMARLAQAQVLTLRWQPRYPP